MKLLVGLGNIGTEYESTRHNFGFLLLDQIIADHSFQFYARKFKSEIFLGEISGEKSIAIKPQTYMNRSGVAVVEVANFFKIIQKDILVLHDDLDLELGKIRVKIGGGHAGHNGLRSIDEMIGKNYMRLRLGIGRPDCKEFATSNYVLGKFDAAETQLVKKINIKISDLVDELLLGKMENFLNKFYAKLV